MHQKEALEIPELANRIIGRHNGLSTFFASNTDTDVSLLDHSHIVRAIANGKSHDVQSVFDHVHDSGLLCGTDAAAKNGFALLTQQKEFLLQVIG
jgi:hypothetical protein